MTLNINPATNGKPISRLGNTGRSTGPHAHSEAAVMRPGENTWTVIDPGTIKSKFAKIYTVDKSGNKIPFAVQSPSGKYEWNDNYLITSGFRTQNRPDHNGIDFVVRNGPTQGAQLFVEDSPDVISYGPGVEDPHGYGYNADIFFAGDDGSKYRLTKAHLDQKPNTWTNTGVRSAIASSNSSTPTTASQSATQSSASASPAGTTLNFTIDIGEKSKDKAKTFLDDFRATLLQSVTELPDYGKIIAGSQNLYPTIG